MDLQLQRAAPGDIEPASTVWPSWALPTTIIVPTLDEAESIGAVLRDLLDPGHDCVLELIVADGGSEDGTQAIVAAAAQRDPRIRLVANRDRVQSAGINRAAAIADPRSEVILRADAHMGYPTSFVPDVLKALDASGADSVAVRLRTVGHGCFQRAVAAVANSAVGTGGAAHRSGGRSAFVDHGHHAAIRRVRFEGLGGYDPDFATNEDAELDLRLRSAGGRIWFAGDIVVDYFPRRGPAALTRQYWRYGRGRAGTYRKHRTRLRLRQMVPPAILVVLLACLVIAPLLPMVLMAPAIYAASMITIGLGLAALRRERCAIAAPVVLAILHLAWGAGFLWGLTAAKPKRNLHRQNVPQD